MTITALFFGTVSVPVLGLFWGKEAVGILSGARVVVGEPLDTMSLKRPIPAPCVHMSLLVVASHPSAALFFLLWLCQ